MRQIGPLLIALLITVGCEAGPAWREHLAPPGACLSTVSCTPQSHGRDREAVVVGGARMTACRRRPPWQRAPPPPCPCRATGPAATSTGWGMRACPAAASAGPGSASQWKSRTRRDAEAPGLRIHGGAPNGTLVELTQVRNASSMRRLRSASTARAASSARPFADYRRGPDPAMDIVMSEGDRSYRLSDFDPASNGTARTPVAATSRR